MNMPGKIQIDGMPAMLAMALLTASAINLMLLSSWLSTASWF